MRKKTNEVRHQKSKEKISLQVKKWKERKPSVREEGNAARKYNTNISTGALTERGEKGAHLLVKG